MKTTQYHALKTVLIVMFISCPAFAQEIRFGSSPNPVGSGARALGMGGAFIAVADDATAASWNPGGLIQLELPEVSIVGAGFTRSEDNVFGGHPESDGSHSVSGTNLNYLSVAYPFNLFERNMIVAVTYQHLYDFSRSWQFDYFNYGGELRLERSVDYDQKGGLSAAGFSYAVQISPALSFGLTMNIWNDDIGNNSWEQNSYLVGSGSLGSLQLHEVFHNLDEYRFDGVNFNLGFMWRLNESLTVGGVYKTPFTADVEHEQNLSHTIERVNSPLGGIISEREVTGSYDETMDMPASYGLGVSYRFTDELTVAFDIYRTEWEDMIYTDYQNVSTSVVSGIEESESDIESTVQLRAGIEYLIIRADYFVPLRAGFLYDPAPSEGSTDDYYGIAIGSGFAWKQFIFDVGYQYRFGNDVGSAIFKSGDLSQDVQEHTLYASLIVHF